MKFIRLDLLCFLLLAYALPSWAAPPAACGTLNAGLQILTGVPTSGSNYAGGLKMAVWYPTTSAPSSYTYSGVGGSFTGMAALNAPAATCAQFPLVIFSHGWSGCGTQSVFLTEQLARLGYIVAAPDHNDHGCSVDGTSIGLLQVNFEFPFSTFGDASSWTNQTASYRNLDIEAVLSYMLNTWNGRSAVNPNEIVMAGHSFGGYTAFAKIGGWSSWLNTRFKAAILFSPYIQAFQSQNPQTVSAATIPQLFMTGGPQDKGIEPWIIGPQPCSGLGSNNCGAPGAFEQSSGTKYYGELPGTGNEATHYAFTNLICTNFGFTSVQSCLSGVPNAATIVNYTQDFLDHFTGGQTPQYLWSTGTQFATYWQTSGAPIGSYKAGMGGAPLEIEGFFGERLTTDAPAGPAGAVTMPQTIGRTSVTVLDSQGVSRIGNLYYVSPQQLNMVIPTGTAVGQAVISVNVGGSVVSSGPVTIKAVAPAVLTLPGNVLAGWGVSGTSPYIPIWSLSGPVPLDVSDGKTYLIAYGTGLRGGASSLTATIGNVQFDGVHAPLPVMAASPSFQGVDQINIGPLPASLRGAGTVNVVLTVQGQQTNSVLAAFQ